MLENIVDNLRINSQPKRKDTPFQINEIIYDDAIIKQVKKSNVQPTQKIPYCILICIIDTPIIASQFFI